MDVALAELVLCRLCSACASTWCSERRRCCWMASWLCLLVLLEGVIEEGEMLRKLREVDGYAAD